jgi:aldehyde oxidoreductase
MTQPDRVEFTLNGQLVSLEVDPGKPLLRVLRQDLALTGVKQACDMEGECGACTVIVDGEAIRSCLLPVAKVAGRSVTTIEGLGTPEQPHPLQVAFLETGAVQCGYCTPGMLLAAKALLDRNPDPTREDISAALEGNMCRCTGYVKIIEAVEMAACLLRGDAKRPVRQAASLPHIMGGDLTRHKGWDKVSGAARYAEDIQMADMRYVCVARSTHFHARVVSVNVTPALAVPGVIRVLTAVDVPGENNLCDYSLDEHLLTPVGGKVRMLGDPIALVVGASPEAAARGAQAVSVEHDELPHTFEIARALEPGAVPIHERGNLLASDAVHVGNVEQATTAADAVIEATYQTSFQAHMALERETAIGYIDEEGRVTIVCGNHEPHWNRGYLAQILGLPPDQVRVIVPPMGGSFGGKQDLWPLAAIAVAAYHLRQPVRMAYTRQEVMSAAPKRHPYTCRCVVSARNDGTLAAMKFDASINTGAYDSAGRYLANYAVASSVGPYRWQAVDSRSQVIYSNGPKAGQFRGFGTPQPAFAMECALDELCERLGFDPLELRFKNALDQNDLTGLGIRNEETPGFREVLEAIRPDYEASSERVAEFNAHPSCVGGGDRGGVKRGVGLAGMWYRFGKFGRPVSQAEAELGRDGRITIYTSSAEYGQGIETVFLQLASASLGVSRDALQLVNADTAHTLDGDVTGASRSTYWVGGAVADASRRLRATILTAASELLDQPPGALALTDDVVRAADGNAVSLAEVAAELERSGLARRIKGQLDLSAHFPDNERNSLYLPLFITGAQVAEVEVDQETGQTRVLFVAAAHDVGKAINPRDAEGQIEGAIVMGIGAALMEEFIPGLSSGFSNYMIPTLRSMPEMRVHLVEVGGRFGPFGAKGLGEAAMLPTAPAIVNAISRAIGARVRHLPATSERILAAIRTAEGGAESRGKR